MNKQKLDPQQLNESLTDFYTDMFSAFQTLGRIDMDAWENAARTQSDMFTLWTSFSQKQLDILTNIRDPQNFAEAQQELSSEFVELSMELAQRSFEQMNDSMTGAVDQIVQSTETSLTAAKLSDAFDAGSAKKAAQARSPKTRKK